MTAIDECPPIACGEGSVDTVGWVFDISVKLQQSVPHGSQTHATVGRLVDLALALPDTARFVTVRWGFDPSGKLRQSVTHGSQTHATVGRLVDLALATSRHRAVRYRKMGL